MLCYFGMQVTLIFSLVILALRLPMLHCLRVFLFIQVVRKLHFLAFYLQQILFSVILLMSFGLLGFF